MNDFPYQRLTAGMPFPPCDTGSFKKCFITNEPTPTKPTHTERGKPSHCHLSWALRSLMGHSGVGLTRGGQIYCVLTHGRKQQKDPLLSHNGERVTQKNCWERGFVLFAVSFPVRGRRLPSLLRVSLTHQEEEIYNLIKSILKLIFFPFKGIRCLLLRVPQRNEFPEPVPTLNWIKYD